MTSLRHAVISADGDLTHHDGPLNWPAVIGPEGRARVHLPDLAVTGWVSDCGLLYPKRYPRNTVGSCVLAALGARVQPYAGPVVFTGWNPANTPLGLQEIESMPQPVEHLDTVHGDVVKALAGQTPRAMSASWAEQIREIAEHARTAPTPGITIRTVTLR
ncbi:hypothetical protein PV413_03540 [Streptomyces scabiei]|uniref:hypothetical protein n=1 Tax=Streptomyces scabiei TaxID=1930 RepID=UPI000E68DB9A|nr:MULTISPECIES: hypothetical protein [Streptomyces]MDX2749585.1 hypothetical protein [Streptomyces scabiei]MDX3026781.1 hypothetical protein [Streptomyces scabiei]MDX3146547.1 hypothetical protein [Streptomyces scabiei]MDX3196953.1 hypothetical protein [Streptomyces scabiei]MDX3210059.1 hypothetical protein [Streptomyces scabiei]